MSWLWWVPTILLGSISLLIIIGNPVAAFAATRRGGSYSFVPLLGGISGFIACWLCPWTAARNLSWLPLLVDITIPIFFYAIIFTDLFRAARKNS